MGARAAVALAVAALVVGAACSSDDDAASDPDDVPADTPAREASTGRGPDEITAPTVEGGGILLPQPSPPLPDGYVEEELFLAGTATSYAAAETPEDGSWTAEPAGEAEYRTRVIVRRPPAETFSGTVLVEWFNVSAIESAPDWAFVSEGIGRAGHAYVGVSAQAQGVEGGETLLDVAVDEDAAADAGADADAVVEPSGLRNLDPERYGTLTHPGDAYAFDIFGQVGRAAAEAPEDLLGGLEPTQVLALGESQSAMFLTTLVNAVHPIDPVFDGFLIHSRGAVAAPLDGDYGSARDVDADDLEAALREAVLVRTDVDVPVFIFEAETDLTLLGYAHARQDDTERIRTWEVAGTAHADAQMLRSMLGGPRDGNIGSVLGCTEPINAGPHPEVLGAALAHLVDWAAGGPPPPTGERLELEPGDEIVIARDDDGIALGGVRNPLVDVPVATLTGEPPGGATIDDLRGEGGDLCVLFGQTIPFDDATLAERYADADDYLERFRASADDAVDGGFLLREDADGLVAEAEDHHRALFE